MSRHATDPGQGTAVSRRRRPDADLRRQAHGSLPAEELVGLEADVEVDALGTFCPEPVIRTQDRMQGMEAGQILLLWADDAGVEVDIPAWCISTRNEYLGLVKGSEAYRVYVRKKG